MKYFADVPATLGHALALCVEYDLLSTWQAGVMLDTVILCSCAKGHSETFYGAPTALSHAPRLAVHHTQVRCRNSKWLALPTRCCGMQAPSGRR